METRRFEVIEGGTTEVVQPAGEDIGIEVPILDEEPEAETAELSIEELERIFAGLD